MALPPRKPGVTPGFAIELIAACSDAIFEVASPSHFFYDNWPSRSMFMPNRPYMMYACRETAAFAPSAGCTLGMQIPHSILCHSQTSITAYTTFQVLRSLASRRVQMGCRRARLVHPEQAVHAPDAYNLFRQAQRRHPVQRERLSGTNACSAQGVACDKQANGFTASSNLALTGAFNLTSHQPSATHTLRHHCGPSCTCI